MATLAARGAAQAQTATFGSTDFTMVLSRIDSSGVGELVGCYTTATHKGAKLKLQNLPPKISDVLTVTQLITVFDVFTNEKEALASFG